MGRIVPSFLAQRSMKSCARNYRLWLRASLGVLDFAAQGAPDKLSKADLLAPRFLGPTSLGLSRQPERHRHTAFGQSRSGHTAICIIVSYTLSRPDFGCCFFPVMTRSAACGTRNQRLLRSLSLLPSIERFRPWRIKSIAGTSPPRSGRCFTKKPGCRPSFECTKRRLAIR